ncbi:putative transcription factor C2H2 family [Helianthus annuus]|uniref:Putative von Willebrand factor, type A, Zinc finger, RING/FYVE/PHD-type n=1 Tax=Helianthus annuus TaxID=4232 RepID=A0A251T6Z8_HELAN|nr:probable E3 ubiquitin-protein ligase EDA40 [Helianthus annuus]KAF5780235.1 putative transcription factor C2H2 family [Helianthus annuus]KAJ0507422.1 putative transcription factor C2H2 family [Helianthus annuus]KAJ0868906.1 putative transcription factor C2H2 family [Helianthus annuus]KAJ0873491.1 putative transcription factor C2H2 family [Helianthus annuus]
MVFRWRKAFCTSLPPREVQPGSTVTPTKDQHEHITSDDFSPKLRCLTTSAVQKSSSVPVSPKHRRKTRNNHRLFHWSSTPSSPRSGSPSPSPSPLSILKSNLRISINKCGLCFQSLKRGRGVAIYTAECSHGFHFPCIASHVKTKQSLDCPVCSVTWQQTPLLPVTEQTLRTEDLVKKKELITKSKKQNPFQPDLKVYNDDERLTSLTPKSRFNPIPESDESCDEDSIVEFQRFETDRYRNSEFNGNEKDVEIRLLPEAAVISSGRIHETCAIVMRVKAPDVTPNAQTRAPVDLVTVVDVSGNGSKNGNNEKFQILKRTMRIIISSLSSSDRLSIVAFTSYSKRLLHLKRMTNTGKRAACRIVEAMAVVDGLPNANDAVRKAVKVLEDRRDRNAVASVILLSDVRKQASYVSSTRHQNVAVHTVKLAAIDDHVVAKTVGRLINVTVQDLELRLGLVSGSDPAEIMAVYSHAPRAMVLGASTVLIGEMCANEEREVLIELKVPSAVGVCRVLSVRCSYRESISQDIIYCSDRALVVPRPHTVRSSNSTIQRLRSLFITTRALAESRQLVARNDLIGAYRLLISARAVVNRTGSDSREFVVDIEAELNELLRRSSACVDERGEPLTPTSAWRVAEKLAKVAVIRKSLNRVSDLHGFEDARF